MLYTLCLLCISIIEHKSKRDECALIQGTGTATQTYSVFDAIKGVLASEQVYICVCMCARSLFQIYDGGKYDFHNT